LLKRSTPNHHVSCARKVTADSACASAVALPRLNIAYFIGRSVMITLVASDIHLGSRNSQAAMFGHLLETDFDRLILNGDIINSLNFKKMKAKHWAVVRQLQKVSRHRELILIRGNHDGSPGDVSGALDLLPKLIGVPLHEEYTLEAAGR